MEKTLAVPMLFYFSNCHNTNALKQQQKGAREKCFAGFKQKNQSIIQRTKHVFIYITFMGPITKLPLLSLFLFRKVVSLEQRARQDRAVLIDGRTSTFASGTMELYGSGLARNACRTSSWCMSRWVSRRQDSLAFKEW